MGSAYPARRAYAVDVRIGDEQRGVPELRPDSVYNRDADVIGERFDIGVDVLTVIAETASEGCIDFETMRRSSSRPTWARC